MELPLNTATEPVASTGSVTTRLCKRFFQSLSLCQVIFQFPVIELVEVTGGKSKVFRAYAL